MYDYIADMLEDLPEDINIWEAATSSGDNLFNTNEDNLEKLIKEETIKLHNLTEKLLYMVMRDRPDFQLGVTFLCTRVKYIDKDDWKKLTRVMKYIWFPRWPPPHTWYWWQKNSPLVCWRRIWGISRHEESYWNDHNHGSRVCQIKINQTYI